jgi:hypothetical protein
MGAWSRGSRGSGGGAHKMAGLPGTVPHWPLGGQGLAGRDGKMRAMKDGPDTVGSCLVGPTLTAPRIAPAFKMFADSRVGAS